MADGITIRITGDDSDFMRTLASLEEETRAALDGLTAAASLAGTAFSAALGASDGFGLSGDGEELARQAARLAETVARAWSGASALEAPSIALSGALPNVGALLEGALASMQADFSAAAETLRAALNDGYLRPGFEGRGLGGICRAALGRACAGGHGGRAGIGGDRTGSFGGREGGRGGRARGYGRFLRHGGGGAQFRHRLDIGFQQPGGLHARRRPRRSAQRHRRIQPFAGHRLAFEGVPPVGPLHRRGLRFGL